MCPRPRHCDQSGRVVRALPSEVQMLQTLSVCSPTIRARIASHAFARFQASLDDALTKLFHSTVREDQNLAHRLCGSVM
eukprot:3283947-Amphidinium_carterae.1